VEIEMDIVIGNSGLSYTSAFVAIGAVAASLICLLLLHFVSPEFGPSWRMVSEYANGRYPWLLTLVFAGWAVSSFALLLALWRLSATTLGKVGLIFLFLAGIGQVMGGLFDINHKLHGPAAIIGIPSLCLAAVILNIALARVGTLHAPPVWTSHLPWISFLAMIGAFVLFFSALKAAGVDVSAQTSPLKELPSGVTGYVGWANRLIFLCSYLWVALAAIAVIKAATLNFGASAR
jgi:hypothetical protein